jgi:CubicO group peptidase (beta-lactamase class C family)
MLYFATKKSSAQYVLQQIKRHEPGRKFNYSSGDTNIVMAALQRALPSKLKDNYPWEFLFDPLNINAIFERDHVGTFLGSSYLYLNTDDLLKIGLLIMNNGIFQDKQIISKSYLNYATGLNEAQGIHGNCDHSSGMTYGAMFWLNRPCKDRDINFKDVPADLIMLLGYGGQNIFIFPSEKIVAVRVAQDKRENGIKLARDEYSRQILKAVKAWRNKDSESEK